MPLGLPYSGVPLRVLQPAAEGWRLPVHPADGPAIDRRSLRAHWTVGLLFGAHDGLVLPFLPLLVLAMGGGAADVAILAAVQAGSQVLGFVPGALVARRLQDPRRLSLVAHGLLPRLALGVLLVLVAIGNASIPTVIVCAAAFNIFMGVGLPAWTAVTADLVPGHRRARFLASRNVGMQVATMTGVLAGGWLLAADASWGFVATAGVATLVGLAAAERLSRIRAPLSAERLDAVPVLQGVASGGFGTLLVSTFGFYLAVWVAAPFFNVHLVGALGASAGQIGALNAVSVVGGLIGGLAWASTLERRGAHRTTQMAMLLIALPPLLWLLVPGVWFAVVPNLVGGFAWAGFNVAWFSRMLDVTPVRNRAAYFAALHGAVYLAQAVGPLVGALLYSQLEFEGTVAISAGGRALALALLSAGGTLMIVRQVPRWPRARELATRHLAWRHRADVEPETGTDG